MKNDSIQSLKSEGYIGHDASLAESLFEYGLAWKADGADLRFIYAHPNKAKRFDWGCIAADTDASKEWGWVKWEDLASFTGMTVEEFLSQPLPRIVADLLQYHGAENVFGTSYTEGFKIEE